MMIRRVRRIVFLMVISTVFGSLIGLGQSCTTGRCKLSPDAPYTVPFGTSVSLDGFIESDWDNALWKPTSLRLGDNDRLQIDLYMMHDGIYLYVGLRATPPKQYSMATPYVYVLFDNGDDSLWNQGDNLVWVPEKNGQLLAGGLDYYFLTYRRRSLDEAQNVQGVGRWNPTGRTYEFEFTVELQSGDSYDVDILPGRPVTVKVGFEVIDRRGTTTVAAEAPPFSLIIGDIPEPSEGQ
jgi:hypothetical protein